MKSPLPRSAYQKNANIYKIFANPKRLEVLNLLKDGEMGVEKILKITKLPKANLSQHLAILRKNSLVKTRRQGLNIFYTIIDARVISPCNILHDLRTKKIIK